jgi:hypothetical protein
MNDICIEEHHRAWRPNDRHGFRMARQDFEHSRFWYDLETVSSSLIERGLQRTELVASGNEVKAATHLGGFVEHDERLYYSPEGKV